MESLPNYPELLGQSVLITGASSGIGAGLASAFAHRAAISRLIILTLQRNLPQIIL